MSEQETGFKWWIRYVIVPMIGGGGIIAIVVAILGIPPKPTVSKADPTKNEAITTPLSVVTTDPQKSNAPAQSPSPLQPQQSVKEPTSAPAESSMNVVKIVPRRTDPLRTVSFYIFDRDTNLPVEGDRMEFPEDEGFTLRWDATSVKDDGPVYVTDNAGPDDRPRSVQPEIDLRGREDYLCRTPRWIHFEMKQKLADGTFRQLGKIDVHCLGR
jgi:hypothetical protein